MFIFSKAVVEDEEGSDEEDAADPTVTEAIVRYYIHYSVRDILSYIYIAVFIYIAIGNQSRQLHLYL